MQLVATLSRLVAQFATVPAIEKSLPRGANGSLRLPSKWLGLIPSIAVFGGPFRHRQSAMFGVCLLESTHGVSQPDIHLPIDDFSIPAPDADVAGALVKIYQAATKGTLVWVGCMGGYGRTGIILALLAKVAGVADPVGFVRKAYNQRAVETAEQVAYIDSFDVRPVRRRLARVFLIGG